MHWGQNDLLIDISSNGDVKHLICQFQNSDHKSIYWHLLKIVHIVTPTRTIGKKSFLVIQKIWFTYNKQEVEGSQKTQNKIQQRLCKRNLHNTKKHVCFEISNHDLKSHNLKLYLINKNISTCIHTWTGSK
jgi:hypothetical protein